MSLAISCLAALIKTCGVAEVQATTDHAQVPSLPSKSSEKLNIVIGTEKQKSGLPSSSILAACRNRVSGFTGGRHQPSCEARSKCQDSAPRGRASPGTAGEERRRTTTRNGRTDEFQSVVNVVSCDSGMRRGSGIAHPGGNNCHWLTDACRNNQCSSHFFRKKKREKMHWWRAE